MKILEIFVNYDVMSHPKEVIFVEVVSRVLAFV